MFVKRSVRSDWRITGGVSCSGLELPAAAATEREGGARRGDGDIL